MLLYVMIIHIVLKVKMGQPALLNLGATHLHRVNVLLFFFSWHVCVLRRETFAFAENSKKGAPKKNLLEYNIK